MQSGPVTRELYSSHVIIPYRWTVDYSLFHSERFGGASWEYRSCPVLCDFMWYYSGKFSRKPHCILHKLLLLIQKYSNVWPPWRICKNPSKDGNKTCLTQTYSDIRIRTPQNLAWNFDYTTPKLWNTNKFLGKGVTKPRVDNLWACVHLKRKRGKRLCFYQIPICRASISSRDFDDPFDKADLLFSESRYIWSRLQYEVTNSETKEKRWKQIKLRFLCETSGCHGGEYDVWGLLRW